MADLAGTLGSAEVDVKSSSGQTSAIIRTADMNSTNIYN